MAQDDEDRIRPPTPPVDPKIAEIASRFHGSSQKDSEDHISDDDDDALLEELEKDDFDISGFREQRLEALKAEIAKTQNMRESDHGRLSEISDEKEVIRTSANEDRCVIHFYHRDFHRCAVMNKHLEMIAPRHFKTRFIKVFVENVPWLVEKLQIKVLPCVVCFIRGVTKDRLIGFEEIGNNDSFTTSALEFRLAQSGVISLDGGSKKLASKSTQSATIRGTAEDNDDGIDWD
ncbi:thioredoxin-like protein [Clavulina sp. PMI_390]|nr:thioredoxin-like protein [Clavulina sp. PMI_390]